jgi:WD40 repeat protein
MIHAECDSCFRTYQLKSGTAGKKFRCKEPGCEGIVEIPHSDEAAPLPSRRSQPKAAAKSSQSMSPTLIVGLVAGGAVFCAVAVTAFLLMRNGNDEPAGPNAGEEIVAAANEADKKNDPAKAADDKEADADQPAEKPRPKTAKTKPAAASQKQEKSNQGKASAPKPRKSLADLRTPEDVTEFWSSEHELADFIGHSMPTDPPPQGEIELLADGIDYRSLVIKAMTGTKKVERLKINMQEALSTGTFQTGETTTYTYADATDPKGLSVVLKHGSSSTKTFENFNTPEAKAQYSGSSGSSVVFSQMKPKHSGLFRGDQRSGEWGLSYDNSQPRVKGSFQNNQRSLYFTCWYPSGKIRWEGIYLNGVLGYGRSFTEDQKSRYGELITVAVGRVDAMERQLEFSPDNRFLSASERTRELDGNRRVTLNYTVTLWEIATGAVKVQFSTGEGVSRMRFSPKSSAWAVTTTGSTRIIDTQSGQDLFSIPGYVQDLRFAADGKALYSLTSGLVSRWSVPEGKQTFTTMSGAPPMAFSVDDELLVMNGPAKEIYGTFVWDCKSEALIGRFKKNLGQSHGPGAVAYYQFVDFMFAPKSKILLAQLPGDDHKFAYWDFEKGIQLSTLPASLRTLRFSKYASYVEREREGGQESYVLTDSVTQRQIAAFLENMVIPAPDSSSITTLHRTRKGPRAAPVVKPVNFRPPPRIWDATTGLPVVLPGPISPRAVRYAPDGQLLAVVGNFGDIAIWDISTLLKQSRQDEQNAPPSVSVAKVNPETPHVGRPLQVDLNGDDPDGDDIGFQYRTTPDGSWSTAWLGDIHLLPLDEQPINLEIRAVDARGAYSSPTTLPLAPKHRDPLKPFRTRPGDLAFLVADESIQKEVLRMADRGRAQTTRDQEAAAAQQRKAENEEKLKQFLEDFLTKVAGEEIEGFTDFIDRGAKGDLKRLRAKKLPEQRRNELRTTLAGARQVQTIPLNRNTGRVIFVNQAGVQFALDLRFLKDRLRITKLAVAETPTGAATQGTTNAPLDNNGKLLPGNTGGNEGAPQQRPR